MLTCFSKDTIREANFVLLLTGKKRSKTQKEITDARAKNAARMKEQRRLDKEKREAATANEKLKALMAAAENTDGGGGGGGAPAAVPVVDGGPLYDEDDDAEDSGSDSGSGNDTDGTPADPIAGASKLAGTLCVHIP